MISFEHSLLDLISGRVEFNKEIQASLSNLNSSFPYSNIETELNKQMITHLTDLTTKF